MMNTIGRLFRLTSFGESHGVAVGGVVDGCPAGIVLSVEELQGELDRRRPGQSPLVSGRKETDRLEVLSGIFEGKTTGMPIAFMVRNRDCRPEDYEALKDVFRPSHADFTWESKYGIRDWRGGGRSSAREHVARVVAGGIARQVLQRQGIRIVAYTSQVGNVALPEGYVPDSVMDVEKSAVRCPHSRTADKMEKLITEMQQAGDSVGGVVSCRITGLPVGLGEPVFDRFQARLAYAMMGINAAKGFEYGEGFHAAEMRGSGHNDAFAWKEGKMRTATNHSGGIQGGITNGEEVYFRVAFKPVSSIRLPQNTVTRDGKTTTLEVKGRHDACVVPRAVPVVEAMAAMTVLDFLLEAGKYGNLTF